MITNTSKLQAKVQALTNVDGFGGVNILANSDEFKSTYDILLEISKVWDRMSDVDQAALLEIIAGKRAGSAVAGILQNGDILEKSYKDALNADGSAQLELNTYLDSVQGKLDQLSNSIQTMWMNFMNSDALKFLISFADNIVKIVDNVGLLPVALGAFAGKTAFNADSFFQIFKFDSSAVDGVKKFSVNLKGAATNVKGMSIATKAAAVGTQLLNAAISSGVMTLVSWGIGKAFEFIDNWVHRAETLKEEVNELTDTYKTAKEEFSDNLEILTVSSDVDSYATLLDEFKKLTQGVNAYGENISLTSDQYERYRQICETIVGINPSLKSGYDDVTTAIGNNASALENLIELQKIQARENAQEYTSDKNIAKIFKDKKNDYDTMFSEIDVPASISWSGVKIDKNGNERSGFAHQIDKYIEEAIGISKGKYDNLAEYIAQNAELIQKNMRNILDVAGSDFIDSNGQKWKALNQGQLDVLYDYLDQTISDLDEYGNAMVDTFLQIPASMAEYDVLTNADKSFVTEWIKNSGLFTIDENTTESMILQQKAQIKQIVKDLANEKYTTNLDDGTIISASDILDSLYNFDTSNVNFSKYKTQVNELLELLWDAIGGDSNSFGFNDQNALGIQLGFELVVDDEDSGLDAFKTRAMELTGKTSKEVQDWLYSLPPTTVRALIGLDWDAEAAGSLTLQGMLDRAIPKVDSENVVTVSAYSVLAEGVEKYNELLTQTSEIISDNIEVTQEYKDSLGDLGISQEDINECFYENEDLVVKDAKKLNDLVKAAKQNTVQNIKLAKSQAQLEYYELYKDMKDLVNGTNQLDDVTRDQVNSLYDQMTAVQRTVAQYSMLEASLLGATNAYDKLAEAQAADEAADYGSKAEELMNVLGDAFISKEVGTQAAQVAIEGLIPDSVFEDADTLDKKMDKIYEYFTGGPVSKLFKIEFDDDGGITSVEMTKENVEDFVETLTKTTFKDADGNSLGTIFEGTWDEFTLNPAIKSLEDFANACNITEEVAFAFLTSLEKYDISWLGGDASTLIDQLMGDDLDYQISKSTQELAELEHQLANNKITVEQYEDAMFGLQGQLSRGVISQEKFDAAATELANQYVNGTISLYEYKKQLNGLSGQEDVLAENAKNNAIAWYETSAAIDEYSEQLKEYHRQLEAGEDSSGNLIDKEEIQKNINDTQGKLNELLAQLALLEEPTEMQMQFAVDSIQEGLDAIEQAIGKVVEDVHYELDIETGKYIVKLDKNDPNYQQVTQYVEWLNQKHTIEAQMGEGTESFTEQLRTIADILENISTLLQEKFELNVDTSSAVSNVKTFLGWWDGLKSKKLTLTQVTRNIVETISNIKWPWSAANGTAHAMGTAYKGGNWGAPKTETALVGELGPEIRVRGNRWELIGQNGAEFEDIQRGDIIFNHEQTEDLLSKGYVTGRGKAYAYGTSGTAYRYALYADVGGGTKKTSLTSLVKDVATTVVKAAKTAAAQAQSSTTQKIATNVLDVSKSKVDAWDSSSNLSKDYSSSSNKGSGSGSSGSGGSSKDDFNEIFDWIEVRIEEITEDLNLLSAQLENAVGSVKQNELIDSMIKTNQELYDTLTAGATKYYEYAATLLTKIPEEYRQAAQDGAIKIEEFAGSADEETLNAIQEYREWVQKGADVTQQAEETLTEISTLAKQAIDNIAADYENKVSLRDIKVEQYDAYNALLETDVGFESANIYQEMINETDKNLATLAEQRNKMQAELNKRVEAGHIKQYSQDWYDAINDIAAVDTQIIELQTDTENWQDDINQLHWDQFDLLLDQLKAISDEADNLIDLLGNKDIVDEVGDWTEEGVTSLGLYAQQMEAAEVQAEKYREEINYLNKNWKKLGYTEQEYIEKLEELKSGQYDAIQSYHDAKDAIVDLNATRVEAIKECIQKEIDAYSELIEKKKEELDAEQDLYGFRKNVMEQEKDIADLERQLAALSADNSSSARAKRAQLEAELAEARAALEDTYYERSISNAQEAYDKELESFQDAKNEEMEGWDEYLEKTDQVVSDSLAKVQANTDIVYQTLQKLGEEYSLSITDALTSPWKEGEYAIQSFSEKFGISMSATVEELTALEVEFKEIMSEIEKEGSSAVNTVNSNSSGYQSATYKEPLKQENSSGSVGDSNSGNATTESVSPNAGLVSSLSGYIQYGNQGSKVRKVQTALNALGFNCGNVDGIFGDKTLAAVKKFQKSSKHGGKIPVDGIVGPDTKNKFKIAGYKTGIDSVPYDQLAIIDEDQLEELVLGVENGRLTYLSKGSSVIPADLTSNLMSWGTIDPQDMLDKNRPSIGVSPSVVNNTMEINVDASIGTLMHVDEFNGDDPDKVIKLINQALDKHTKNLNTALKKFTR